MDNPTFETPDALFELARQEILHQDDALRALCVPLFYHLKYKAYSQAHDQATDPGTKKIIKNSKMTTDDFYKQLSHAFGINHDELKCLDEVITAQGGQVTAVQISIQESDMGDERALTDDNVPQSTKKNSERVLGRALASVPDDDVRPEIHFPYPDFLQMRASLRHKYLAKAPLFVTGKTGSGKTHLIKTLCQLAGMNFVMINVTHLSNAGYKGMTLADVGEMLVKQAGDEREALHSVVFFDEFDKLFLSNSTSVQDWHRALATEMLTIIEGTSNFPVKDSAGIPSRHMLFILGGSFTMHQDTTTPIGFTTKNETISPDEQMNLTKLGLPDELAGRIGRMIGLRELLPHELGEILLYSPSSPFVALAEQLALVNCTVGIEEALIDELIEREREAIDTFGVRGLYQGFYKLSQVQDILDHAASHPYHHFVIKCGEAFLSEYRAQYKPVPPPPRFELKRPPKRKQAEPADDDDDLSLLF